MTSEYKKNSLNTHQRPHPTSMFGSTRSTSMMPTVDAIEHHRQPTARFKSQIISSLLEIIAVLSHLPQSSSASIHPDTPFNTFMTTVVNKHTRQQHPPYKTNKQTNKQSDTLSPPPQHGCKHARHYAIQHTTQHFLCLGAVIPASLFLCSDNRAVFCLFFGGPRITRILFIVSSSSPTVG